MTQATTTAPGAIDVDSAPQQRCGLIICDALATDGGYCTTHREEQNQRHREYRADIVSSQGRYWQQEIGVPTRYCGVTFANSKPTVAIAKMREYRDQRGVARGRAVFIASATGAGKTHAAITLLNDLLPYLRTSMRFYLAAQLVRELLDFDTAADVMESAARCRLLVLDDLQVPPRADAVALVEELLVRREAEGLPLVCTTNLRRAQFEAGFGDRAADRLRAWGTYHELGGKSLRGGGA